MTLNRDRDGINGEMYVTFKDDFIRSSANRNSFEKDTLYKINAYSNDSSIFNIVLGDRMGTSYTYDYCYIKEIVKDIERVKEYLAIQNKYKIEKIENLRKEKKLIHPDDILQIVNDIFGEDRVYIKKSEIDNFYNSPTYNVYIHFPTINITNSRDEHHIIKNLYVKFAIQYNINNDDLSISLYGRRMTLSLKEWESNYGHSHFSGRANSEFTGFCLGSSDFGGLIMDTKIEKTEDAWTMMFMSLENYLKWESIEGGPYRYIKDISYGNNINEHVALPHLANIISGIDKNEWLYINNYLVLKDSYNVYIYFDKYSKLRSACGYDKAETEHKLNQIKRGAGGNSLDWKGVDVKFEIYSDDVLDEGYKLDRAVVDLYHQVINRQFKIFNLKKTQNEYKQRNHKKVFGEISTVKQA